MTNYRASLDYSVFKNFYSIILLFHMVQFSCSTALQTFYKFLWTYRNCFRKRSSLMLKKYYARKIIYVANSHFRTRLTTAAFKAGIFGSVDSGRVEGRRVHFERNECFQKKKRKKIRRWRKSNDSRDRIIENVYDMIRGRRTTSACKS